MSIFVTTTGFQKKSLTDIKAELENTAASVWGSGVDLASTGPLGQFIGLISKGFADLWEGAQEIYDSRDPYAATGVSLDKICGEVGLYRVPASKGTAILYLSGVPGTVVPANSLVKAEGQSVNYLTALQQISNNLLEAALIELEAPSNGKVYSFKYQLNNGSDTLHTATYTATGADTLNSVRTQLLSQVIDPFDTAIPNFSAGSNRLAFAYVDNGTNNPVEFTVPATTFTINTLVGMSWVKATTKTSSVCDTAGEFSVGEGTLTTIVTPISGWLEVYNPAAGIQGTDAETDAQLRSRLASSSIAGKSTEEAIRNAILSRVDNVGTCQVFSNRTMATAGGRPPKSFEVFVTGAVDPNQVGKVIWDTMPAGIESYGNQLPVTVVDGAGNAQTVYWSKPVSKYIWVKVTKTLYSEEVFPTNGVDLIKQAIVDWSLGEYSLGKDVIYQRIAVPVWTIPGLATVSIEVAVGSASGSFPSTSAANLAIAAGEIATFDITRIQVV